MIEMIALGAKYAMLIIAFIGFLALGFILFLAVACFLLYVVAKAMEGFKNNDSDNS